MSAHTPTPWRVIKRGNQTQSRTYVVGGPSNEMIDPPVNAADAAFIVRAANNHDALVAALREMLDLALEANTPGAMRTGWADAFARAVPDARATLAAAEAA